MGRAVTLPARAVRVRIRTRRDIPTTLETRRARIEAIDALARYLGRLGLESRRSPMFDVSVDQHGTWWCQATVATAPETWRTRRHRKFAPCDTCGRRGNGVAITDDGPRCRNGEACARAAAHRRVCDECGCLGTRYNILTTETGMHLCKTGCAIITTTAAVMPSTV